MASANQDLNKNDNHDESSPLLPKQEQEQQDEKKTTKLAETKSDKVKTDAKAPVPAPAIGFVGGYAWTADGLPLRHGGSVVGEPMGRSQWNSGICACLGRNDEFLSSDLEVCALGSCAPCVLYGSNVERLGSNPGTFANHCSTYAALYLIGKLVFRLNCLAPCFSYNSRTAIRRRFNLEARELLIYVFILNDKQGSCEALHGTCGCCGSFIEDEVQREKCESACDFATHFFCHPCSLCQEGREIRRRMPHPGFNAQPFLVMIPPVEQAMGRGA
ncbi:cell number regulator 8 [Quercus suber]|uniref:Cell number regulator 8 n=1 Tax=Quercus suber TaxID=58331 RepID=A0AAW0LRE6_QUESU